MPKRSRATARAYANIAFIKYWGNRDERLRLPASPSLSMNLDGLYTQTSVNWGVEEDTLTINGKLVSESAHMRVCTHLNELRNRFQIRDKAYVESQTNIPLGAGIASSAAAFAALTVAALAAAGIERDEATISTLARLGSGSAARSIPNGFVAWPTGSTHDMCFAYSIAPPEHWALADVIAIVHSGEKAVSSLQGHQTSITSPLQSARISSAAERFETCKQAILSKDFDALAAVVELDSNAMHAVMMTSKPPLLYWHAASLTVMHAVTRWRARGIPVCYTLDAGPNVHCICTKDVAPQVRTLLHQIPSVCETRMANVGNGAHILHD